MADPFQPLDLTDSCNVGDANVRSGDGWMWPFDGEDPDNTQLKRMPSGENLFWGVPFTGAPDDASLKYVAVCGADAEIEDVPESVTISVGNRARRLLFAHACAPATDDPDAFGQQVGMYRVHFDDGSSVEQNLRRRFEIHDFFIRWGHHPFACRVCREFRSVPIGDLTGPWGRTQVGTTTLNGGSLAGWWLLDWVNPTDKIIDKIEVLATGTEALALGAITICQEEKDPFDWPARKEIAITIDDADGTQAPQLKVDRGVLVRQDRLFVPGEDFVATEVKGFGTGGQQVREGGYAEVHASPEGRVSVSEGSDGDGEADGGGTADAEFRWGDVLESGSERQGKVRIEVIGARGKQWVHVRVEDTDSGKPVGSRVHFRSESGSYLAPHGHQADVNTGWFEDLGGDCTIQGTPYAYIDGTCQIELPVGTAYVEVVRGFEYEPLRQKLEIKPGQRNLTLRMQRAFDMKSRGYYSGDTHVHFLSSQSSHLEAAAEDLNVVNLLASQWGRLFTSWEEFTGGLSPTSSEDHLIWVSQENRQHVLGHISLLGLKEMVAPMCTGGPDEDWVGGEIQTLMADWSEECRRQGGLVIMPHMPSPDFENAANIVLGQADAAEMCWIWQGENIGAGERGYYRWLNVGQKLPIVGGTDKMSNDRVLGCSRTYAKLDGNEEFTFDNWCRGVRRGNTFASTGAMIDLQVEGASMGEEIHLPGNGGTVEVQATAESVWPLSAVELVVNGVPDVREEADPDFPRKIVLNHKLKTETPCWVTARCWGPHGTGAGPVMAHSSPVYIDVGGRDTFEPVAGEYLLTQMEGGVTWAEHIGVFKDEAVRARLIALFREGMAELDARSR
jgi:hypothetical protein